MLAALASQTPCANAHAILHAFGYEVFDCPGRAALEELLETKVMDLVLCDMFLDDRPSADLPERYADTAWIACIDRTCGWALGAELHRLSGFCDVLYMPVAETELFASLWAISQMRETGCLMENTARHAEFRWMKKTYSSPPSVTLEHYVEKLDDVFAVPESGSEDYASSLQVQFFRPGDSGFLSQTQFARLWYRITAGGMTGLLHLIRQGLRITLCFESGSLYDVQARDPLGYFDIRSWCNRNGISQSFAPGQSRREFLKALPDAASHIAKWARALVLEIFTWSEAAFDWQTDNLPPRQNFHPTPDMLNAQEILAEGIFKQMPVAFVLEVTHSCLSYFLKLKDNMTGLDHAFLPPQAIEVAESVKKGDTLPGMLAAYAADYPVHQVIYLYLVMGQLDLIA
ncbi:MAG: DUF4388 domain-containing protein [Proteobacteria bacterium]|nr:DUF4388 domain-containing protein [Pseudomonadota bacterium]